METPPITSDLLGRSADGRKLIAVVHIDMVGYSRLIGLDDAGTIARLQMLRRTLIDPAVKEHGGRIAQTAGDSLLIVFDSIDGAVRCAMAVQQQTPRFDGEQPADKAIRFRVGINIGDVIAEGTDIHGDGVNVAVRLQGECPPGGICVSRAVRDHVHDRLGLDFEELGPLSLKNIVRPVEGFVLWPDPNVRPSRPALPDRGIGKAPRLSVVVLPFLNLTGDSEQEYLADGITEELTTDLSQLPGAFIIARNSAFRYKGKPVDVKEIGEALGVRYAVEGSVRRLGSVLRLNVGLTSTETGAQLWADRFDQGLQDLGVGQDEIVRRIGTALNIRLFDVEGARSVRERPSNPDAFDLILRARWLEDQPHSSERTAERQALYERALELDPASVPALTGLALTLMDRSTMAFGEGTVDMLARAETLIASAAAIRPNDQWVLWGRGYLLQARKRWSEAISAFQRTIDTYPNNASAYHMMGVCKTLSGAAEHALTLFETSLRLDPLEPQLHTRFSMMGLALLLIGRDEESISWFQRALSANPEYTASGRSAVYRRLGCAYALTGRANEARIALADANSLWPYATVRGDWRHPVFNPVLAEQFEHIKQGLRLAGLRDHAEEDADFGEAPHAELRQELAGLTPTTAPGATTIRTGDLSRFLAQQQPVVIDTVQYSWGRSIPQAVGLVDAGLGGNLGDAVQHRLGKKMRELTNNDISAPIVAVGWNSERFDGRNLALRLVTLGYGNVYWYRGGREAWEVAGLPETDLLTQDW
jgi:adenylate cyclase